MPPGNSIDPVEYGKLLAQVTQLRSDVDNISRDMREVLEVLQSARGGWKVMVAIGGLSAAFGGLLVKFLPILQAIPR
jgi:hypothetical protein